MFVLTIVAAIAALTVVVVARVTDAARVNWIALAPAGLALAFLFFASFAQVSTRNVGIVTSFGRPVENLDNGPHFIAPWESVTEMPATVQTDSYTQARQNCVTVRIAYGMTGCVDTSIRWRIKEEAASTLFQNYQDFDNVRNSLVTRELALAANQTFADYDPLAFDANGNSTAPPLSKLGDQIQTRMTSVIGGQIEVVSVFTSIMHYDSAVQGRINALQAQVANTKIAVQSEQTAAAQAAANQALSSSVNTSSNVLVSRCLDLMQQMINDKMAVPPGFSCWPGGGASVVVGAK